MEYSDERRRFVVSGKAAAVVVTLAAFLAFGSGIMLGKQTTLGGSSAFAAETLFGDQPPAGVDFSPVWRAWSSIDERFVPTGAAADATATNTPATGFTDPQERVWGMIQGLAASLDDPYTVFLPPSDAKIFQDDISGSFEGVGMEIAIRDSVLTIVSPLKNTPAFRAGLKAGDLITHIDGESTRGMQIDGAVKRIRGERGTTVVLTVRRAGESGPFDVDVVRDVIEIPTISAELREGSGSVADDDVYVIELLNFGGLSSALFRGELRNFIKSGTNKLVLDLRGNPGGFLGAAVDMASWFLPTGKTVVTEDYGKNGQPIAHRSRGYDVFNDNLKMVILIDKGSASASEILAGALAHYEVATLVGEYTFGKGSVQELVDITPNTSLKITVARWLLPGGEPIPHEGIAPDVEVKITDEDREAERDPQMEEAVRILLGTSTSTAVR